MRTWKGSPALAALSAALLVTCVAPAYADGIRGFPPGAVAQERAREQIANASPNATTALRDERALAGEVHRMGQPADYKTAVYVRDRLAAAGWDAKIVTYVVPIAWPIEQRLEIAAPFHREVDLYEPAIPADPWSRNHAAIGKPYSGYSVDGDVSGPLIYANYGTAADLVALQKLHVSVRGAVLLIRSGKEGAATKALRAAAHGARAMLSYVEPGTDPFFPKLHPKPYPNGPGMPLGAARRNSMMFLNDSGDPTAIGIPVPGAKHKPFSAIKLPPIPYSVVTGLVAQQLAQHLGGPPAPPAWKTKLQKDIGIGGAERVHFTLKSKRFFGPIWDVIARMRGAVEPLEVVVVGGHRDVWAYGAIDNTSGTVVLLQLGDAFGKLRRQGWRPYRTVVIGSWDGEELNLFGSDIWVDQHEDELTRKCWAYVNSDEAATGPTFVPYATDDLGGLIRSVADAATAPNGMTLNRYWTKQDRKRLVGAPGTGSDHESFTYHENIPSLGMLYAGVFGTWHSAYDDVASMKIFDPGMRYIDAAARFTSLATLRLADAPYPDIRLNDDSLALQRRLNSFGNGRGWEARRALVVHALQPYIAGLVRLTTSVDNAADQAAAASNVVALKDLRALSLDIRSAFYSRDGIPGDRWQHSVLYSSDDNISVLPTLEATLDPKKGDAALRQLVESFQKVPPLLLVSR